MTKNSQDCTAMTNQASRGPYSLGKEGNHIAHDRDAGLLPRLFVFLGGLKMDLLLIY